MYIQLYRIELKAVFKINYMLPCVSTHSSDADALQSDYWGDMYNKTIWWVIYNLISIDSLLFGKFIIHVPIKET